MGVKFRFHRGGFEESMATTQEVSTLDELSAILKTIPSEITFDYCGFDERNGWDTYYVSVNNMIRGLSDGLLK